MAEMVARQAHPALRRFVTGYVGYCLTVGLDELQRGLPSPAGTLIISFESPLDVGWDESASTGARSSRGPYWLMAGGLHLTPAVIRPHGRLHGIQVDFTPDGAWALLGLPIAPLKGQIADHADLPGGIDPATHEAMAEAADWPTRFDLLEARLLHLLPVRDHQPRAEVSHAWQVIEDHHGNVSIEAVAAEVGWSRRTLARHFAQEYGVGPKQAARLHRFQHARRLVEVGTSLADTAARCGFADQSHLSHEWQALAGSPPAPRRIPVPNLHDGVGVDAAG